jgi:glucose/arabinose dehydrogenase
VLLVVALTACQPDPQGQPATEIARVTLPPRATATEAVAESPSATAAPTESVEPATEAPTPTEAVAPAAPVLDDYALAEIVTGLQRPVFLTAVGDDLYVIEQPGRIRIVRDGQLLETPFLDISERVNDEGNEQGLLGLAFPPNFAERGGFYVNYTGAREETVIARFGLSLDADAADPDSEQILLTIDQPYSNHNGGMLAFGPDGYLYVGMGDGGAAGDPENRAQNMEDLLGKMLRLDVSGAEVSVPADNPFVGQTGVRPEIWSYGLRNPWRFSFDRANGDLWMGDVGQNEVEEVNRQPGDSAGSENYGWRFFEGSADYEDADQAPGDVVAPVAEYTHGAGGCSVTGGYVYRGQALPALNGVYFFGDYCSGLIWATRPVGDGRYETTVFGDAGMQISSFGEDAAGELYVIDHGGAVYRLVGR